MMTSGGTERRQKDESEALMTSEGCRNGTTHRVPVAGSVPLQMLAGAWQRSLGGGGEHGATSPPGNRNQEKDRRHREQRSNKSVMDETHGNNVFLYTRVKREASLDNFS